MFTTKQLALFLADDMERDDKTVLKFLSQDLYFKETLQLIYVTRFFHFQKKLLLFNMFKYVLKCFNKFNINEQMKNKLLKNEEDTSFYA